MGQNFGFSVQVAQLVFKVQGCKAGFGVRNYGLPLGTRNPATRRWAGIAWSLSSPAGGRLVKFDQWGAPMANCMVKFNAFRSSSLKDKSKVARKALLFWKIGFVRDQGGPPRSRLVPQTLFGPVFGSSDLFARPAIPFHPILPPARQEIGNKKMSIWVSREGVGHQRGATHVRHVRQQERHVGHDLQFRG